MKLRVIPVFIVVVGAILLLKTSVEARGPEVPPDPAHRANGSIPSGVESASQIPGPAFGVFLQGDYAYLAAGVGGLRIIDISNPTAPVEVGSFVGGGDTIMVAQNVAVAGRYAYVADLLNGLRIIDVLNPAAPQEVTRYPTVPVEGFYDVAVVGRFAYVASFKGVMHIINVTDPTLPAEVGSYNAPDNLRGVVVKGDYAYVAAEGAGLRIVNITNSAQPTEVGFSPTPGEAWDVAIAEAHAYVADGAGGLRIVDVSDPAAPFEAGFSAMPGFAQGLAVLRNHAYVAAKDDVTGNSGLRIINISDPTAPVEDVGHTEPTNAWDAAVAQGWVYVTDENLGKGMHIYYFAPPTVVTVSPGQESELVSPYDDTRYIFPPGTFTDTVIITHTPRFAGDVPPYDPLVDIGHIFELTAVYSSTGKPAQPAPGFTYTMTIRYRQSELGFAIEKTLDFYYVDAANKWVREPTSNLAMAVRTVTAAPSHLSFWAVLGERRGIFLPLILRSP